MRLSKKIALVTGATGQLGRQFCHVLAKEGASVWVSDLELDRCEKVVSNLYKNQHHHPLSLDVSNPESVRNAFSEIRKIIGSIDIIINNAGIAVFTPFEDRNFDDEINTSKI